MTTETKPAAQTITYEGRDYLVPEVETRQLVHAIWQHLRTRINPLDAIAERFEVLKDKPELKEALLDRAMKAIMNPPQISKEEALAFLDSPDGLVWSLTWIMQQADPTVNEDLVRRIVIKEQLEALQKIRDQAARRMIEAASKE